MLNPSIFSGPIPGASQLASQPRRPIFENDLWDAGHGVEDQQSHRGGLPGDVGMDVLSKMEMDSYYLELWGGL